MATRASFAGSVAASDPIQASDPNNLPGGLIGYATSTGNQGSIAGTAVDLTSMTLTLTPQPSRMLKLSWIMLVSDSVAQGTTETFRLYLLKDASIIDQYDYVANPGAGTNNFTVEGFALDNTPTNASHVYKLQGSRSGTATGTFTIQGSATSPARFIIEDVGPSF